MLSCALQHQYSFLLSLTVRVFASYEATWGSKKTRVSFKQYLVTRAAHGDDAAFAEVCTAFAKEVTTWRALKHQIHARHARQRAAL